MQGFPKAVAGAAKVMANGNAVKAGVDATEEDFEVGADDVRHGLPVAGSNFGFAGFRRGSVSSAGHGRYGSGVKSGVKSALEGVRHLLLFSLFVICASGDRSTLPFPTLL